MKKVDKRLLPDREIADIGQIVFAAPKKKWTEIRIDLGETVTLADLLEHVKDKKPEEVHVEYAGCGSHAIELILKD